MAQLSNVIALAQKLEQHTFTFHRSTKEELLLSFRSYTSRWACDQCLADGRAIIANPFKQDYCWYPFYAYRDIGRVCECCNQHFVFSKSEQRFWFEELQFWHEVKPKHCLACRKEIRAEKKLNKRLSVLLKAGTDILDISQLEEVQGIYEKMGKEEKSKYIKAMIRKRSRLICK